MSNVYINTDIPLLIKCQCGNDFYTAFKYFKQYNKRQCNQCSHKIGGRKQAKSTEIFRKEVYNLVGDEYEVIGEYITHKDKIQLLHKECNQIFKISPNAFLNGQRCIPCNKNYVSPQEFEKIFEDKSNNEFELLSEYKTYHFPVKAIHKYCGCVFYFKPYSLYRNAVLICPNCHKSRGEKIIEDYLKLNKIHYDMYKKLTNLRLSFDFILK